MNGIDDVWLACFNQPRQVVVSGTPHGLDAMRRACAEAGVVTVALDVSNAFHSPRLAAADEAMRADLADRPVSSPVLPFVSSVNAEVCADSERLRELWARHASAPVRFGDAVRTAYDQGARVFLQVTGGNSLLTSVRRNLTDHGDVHVVPVADPRRRTAAEASSGPSPGSRSWAPRSTRAPWFPGRNMRLLDLPVAKLATQSYWVPRRRPGTTGTSAPSHRPQDRSRPTSPEEMTMNDTPLHPMDELLRLVQQQTALLARLAETLPEPNAATEAALLARLAETLPERDRAAGSAAPATAETTPVPPSAPTAPADPCGRPARRGTADDRGHHHGHGVRARARGPGQRVPRGPAARRPAADRRPRFRLADADRPVLLPRAGVAAVDPGRNGHRPADRRGDRRDDRARLRRRRTGRCRTGSPPRAALRSRGGPGSAARRPGCGPARRPAARAAHTDRVLPGGHRPHRAHRHALRAGSGQSVLPRPRGRADGHHRHRRPRTPLLLQLQLPGHGDPPAGERGGPRGDRALRHLGLGQPAALRQPTAPPGTRERDRRPARMRGGGHPGQRPCHQRHRDRPPRRTRGPHRPRLPRARQHPAGVQALRRDPAALPPQRRRRPRHPADAGPGPVPAGARRRRRRLQHGRGHRGPARSRRRQAPATARC